MAKTLALVQFKERRYQVYFLDFRVFIQSVEVTQFVTSAVAFTYANRDSPNSASFTLDNAMDRFVITEENLAGTWRDTNDRYSEAAKHGIYLYKTGERGVTQDRITELVSKAYDKELDSARERSRTANEKLLRGKIDSNESDEDVAARVAAQESTRRLPGVLVTQNVNRDKVNSALSSKVQETTKNKTKSDEIADSETKRHRNRVTRANGRNPQSSNVVEVDPSSDNDESGKHKKKSGTRNPVDSDTGDRRWPLTERTIIFHKNDPVRIFVHNPLTEGLAGEGGTGESTKGFWLHGFTGFVDTYPKSDDYVNGHSTIQIQCYDIRALLMKMRVQTNMTRATREPDILFKDRSSVFADMLSPNDAGHPFVHKSFEDAMSSLLAGTDASGKSTGRRFGVGDLKVGKVRTYPTGKSSEDGDETGKDPSNRSLLEEWHTLCVNGPSDSDSSIARLEPLRDKEVVKIGRGTTTDDFEFSPLAAQIHFLLPKEGTAASTLVQESFDDRSSEKRDFVTRFAVITDFCATIDYEMMVAGNGDIIFEFPMYDFLPEDFGDWAPVFRADFHLIGGEVADESGDIVTALTVTGGPSNVTIGDEFVNSPLSRVPRGLIASSIMAARVGVTVESRSLPFVRKGERLRSLGLIEFQKCMANANSFNMQFGFRPFITPNRPVFNVIEQRMGITSSVGQTLQVHGEASTSVTTRHTRQVRDDGSFRFITGGRSMPISYRTIFPGNVKSVGNGTVGVRSIIEYDGDPTLVDNNATTGKSAATKPTNHDRPPDFIQEKRPGTFFTMAPSARRVAEVVAQTLDDRDFLLNNIPVADGRSFSVRARDSEGIRVYNDKDREQLAKSAKDNGYILIDTRNRFVFEPRKPGQPDFIVRSDNA